MYFIFFALSLLCFYAVLLLVYNKMVSRNPESPYHIVGNGIHIEIPTTSRRGVSSSVHLKEHVFLLPAYPAYISLSRIYIKQKADCKFSVKDMLKICQ